MTKTITMNTDCRRAQQEAGELFEIAVEIMAKDSGATIEHNRISTLLGLASRLSGQGYEALYHAATELAHRERTIRQRLWENRQGLAQHPREAFCIPTPKHDAVERSLRGY